MQDQESMKDGSGKTAGEPSSDPEISSQDKEPSQEKPDQSRAKALELEQQLARLESNCAELKDAFLRAKADSENIQRRARIDVANAYKYTIESFAESLLPVKDSLEMALQVKTPSFESLKEGVEMALKQLSAAFEKNALLEVNARPGAAFDPARHQAIATVPSAQPSNTIVDVLQKGYVIVDRLLRPALVTVAQQEHGSSQTETP